MTQPAPGTLAWFEVATDEPDGAEKFYGSLFDWSFDADGPAASGGMDYRNITASGADGPMGGIFATGGQMPQHAVFYIVVADIEATCADAGSLVRWPGTTGSAAGRRGRGPDGCRSARVIRSMRKTRSSPLRWQKAVR